MNRFIDVDNHAGGRTAYSYHGSVINVSGKDIKWYEIKIQVLRVKE